MSLPISLSLPAALALVLAAGVAAFAGGAWLGAEWRGGRDAIAERDDLRRQVEALDAAAAELRRRGLAVAQDFRTAQIRFETIAEGLSNDFASLDAAFVARMADLESLVAAHPEWGHCRIGTDGVYAWNAAAAGANPAATPSAADAGTAARAVPGDAAAAGRRPSAGAVEQLPGSGAGVSPLPLQDGAPDSGAGDP